MLDRRITNIRDFNGTPISDGDMLRAARGHLAMLIVTGNKYHLGNSGGPYKIWELPHYPVNVDDKFITEHKLVIDKGRWIVIPSNNHALYDTYEQARMSDLFGEPDIYYLSEWDIRSINSWEENT